MSLKKKLTRHGNSLALVIERSILDLLGIDGSTLLTISSPDGCSLVITPEDKVPGSGAKNLKAEKYAPLPLIFGQSCGYSK